MLTVLAQALLLHVGTLASVAEYALRAANTSRVELLFLNVNLYAFGLYGRRNVYTVELSLCWTLLDYIRIVMSALLGVFFIHVFTLLVVVG